MSRVAINTSTAYAKVVLVRRKARQDGPTLAQQRVERRRGRGYDGVGQNVRGA